MFGLGKLVGFLLHPLAWVAVLLALGLLWQAFGRHRTGGVLHALALVLLLLLGWEYPASRLVATIETQYPVNQQIPDDVKGIIVLGGSTDRSSIWDDGKRSIPLNESAERLTEMTRLMRLHPEWHIVFAGGNGGYFVGDHERSEARLTQVYLAEQGLDPARVMFEGQSRNTRENARYAANLPGVNRSDRWLLVTSAWHMPRAMETFRKEGWNVVAHPVDFRSDPYVNWRHHSFKHGPLLWQMYFREKLGLWVLQNFSWGSR
jgi:uncharacterized SAM-binding protein YcdF (DUF218 family)